MRTGGPALAPLDTVVAVAAAAAVVLLVAEDRANIVVAESVHKEMFPVVAHVVAVGTAVLVAEFVSAAGMAAAEPASAAVGTAALVAEFVSSAGMAAAEPASSAGIAAVVVAEAANAAGAAEGDRVATVAEIAAAD